MRDSLDIAVDRKTAGLDDVMLKKMLLAYNSTNYSVDTDIIIELTEDEKDACESDSEMASPYDMVQGKDIDQLDLNVIETVWNDVKNWITNLIGISQDDKDEEFEQKRSMQNKYYLKTKGNLVLKNENGEKLVYYDIKVLENIYKKQYLAHANNQWGARDYAESVWQYLDKCYTEGTNGIQMYSYEKVDETLTVWNFDDDGFDSLTHININRNVNVNMSAKRELQNINYYSFVSEYATPVEFMVDLMEVTGSRDFINAFIDKVANETTIELTLYKTGYIYNETIKEEINERTEVQSEIRVGAKVTGYVTEKKTTKYYAGVPITVTSYPYNKGNGGITVNPSVVEGSWGQIKRRVKLTNLPSNIYSVNIELEHKGLIKTATVYKNSNGEFIWEEGSWISRYETQSNPCKIKQTKTVVNTETKYDIAIKKVNTWYANINYNYAKKMDVLYESKDAGGNLVEVSNKDGIIMNTYSKATEVYEKNSSNANTIFNTSNSITDIALQEVANMVEEWFADLTSDKLGFYLTGGHLTHRLYTAFDGNKYNAITNDECINIKFIYAIQSGVFDDWFIKNYDPKKISCIATSYKKGELYTTVNAYLVETSPPTVADNSEFFLALLRNSTGVYRRNATYDPDGKDIEYDDLYRGNTKVGELLLNGEKMLYELLETSPNTQRLAGVMQEILWKYKNNNAGSSGTTMQSILNLQGSFGRGGTYGATVEEKIWYKLMLNGMTNQYAIAAVIGAIDDLSNLNPLAKNSDGGAEAVGLALWKDDRKNNLESFAAARGRDSTDLDMQIEFLIAEITGGGADGYADDELQITSYEGQTFDPQSWKNATSVEEASKAFYYTYVKPDEEVEENEWEWIIQNASRYHTQFDGKTVEEIADKYFNETQLKIVEVAKNCTEYGIVPQGGYCMGWVTNVYKAAGAPAEGACCARCGGNKYSVSKDFTNMPIGACVYSYSHSQQGKKYGHVVIYLGDGLVAGCIRRRTNWNKN